MDLAMQGIAGINVSRWAGWGFVGGTAVAAAATVVGGAPITAWVCTKCLFTGMVAGVAAVGLKAVKNAENERQRQLARVAAERVERVAVERVVIRMRRVIMEAERAALIAERVEALLGDREAVIAGMDISVVISWAGWGMVGGTAVIAGATVVGGAPITAWVCTKCLFTGIVVGVAAAGLRAVENAEDERQR